MLAAYVVSIGTSVCNRLIEMMCYACGGLCGTFAVAEIRESFTGDNFIKDKIGEKWYTGLMIATVAATILMCIIGPKFQCFKEGTLVKTKDGLKAIEEIKEGDLVLSYDEKTGKSAYKILNKTINMLQKMKKILRRTLFIIYNEISLIGVE